MTDHDQTEDKPQFVTHFQIPRQLLCESKPYFSAKDRMYMIVCSEHPRWISHAHLSHELGVPYDTISRYATELAADNRVERSGGSEAKVRLLVDGLSDVDQFSWEAHCARHGDRPGVPVVLKAQQQGRATANLGRVAARVTDAEWKFLLDHNAFGESIFWSKTLPEAIRAVTITSGGSDVSLLGVIQQSGHDEQAAMGIVTTACIRAAAEYPGKIQKLSSLILRYFLADIIGTAATHLKQVRSNWADLQRLPTLADRYAKAFGTTTTKMEKGTPAYEQAKAERNARIRKQKRTGWTSKDAEIARLKAQLAGQTETTKQTPQDDAFDWMGDNVIPIRPTTQTSSEADYSDVMTDDDELDDALQARW